MRISVNRKKCTGCHLCELVCSLFHLGVINPEKAIGKSVRKVTSKGNRISGRESDAASDLYGVSGLDGGAEGYGGEVFLENGGADEGSVRKDNKTEPGGCFDAGAGSAARRSGNW